jgi:NAD-dependent dihydropyrimidine dehydrogenase PreA subunit
MVEEKAKVNPDGCVECGVCIDACPVAAISL